MVSCVNNETKTCVLGYGMVRISAYMQTIRFQEIDTPVEPGTLIFDEYACEIGDWKYTGNKIVIFFNSLDEVDTLRQLLDEIEQNKGGSFTFKNITFEFTQYNPLCIVGFRAALDQLVSILARLMAF